MDRNPTTPHRPATAAATAGAVLRPIPDAVPAALRAVERWICWRAQPRAGGKLDKVPHSPQTGRRCDAHDPANWGSFDQALAAMGRHRLDGIGIVLAGGDALVGLDLDRCVGEDGAIAPWAAEIVAAMDSYTERSPSGCGLRILAVGTLPPGRRATAGLEMYDARRFLTVTGHHLAGTLTTIERRDEALRAVHTRYLSDEAAPAPVPTERTPNPGEPPPLDELRAMLRCIPSRLTYEAWLHVLMAVHEAYPGIEGVQLCEEWSPGYDGEIAKKFASFKRHGVGVGTLVHLAKQHGWQPPERPAPTLAVSNPAPSCGAQVASHSAQPPRPAGLDRSTVPEELRRYVEALERQLVWERREHDTTRRERDALREENRELRRERNEGREHYRLRLQVLRNRTIKPATRQAIIGLADVLEEAERKGKTAEDGWTPAYAAAIADQAGLETRSVSTLTTELDALGLVEKETELHRKTIQTDDDHSKSVLCSVSRFRPADGSVAAMLRRAATIAAPERGHGGERPKAPAPPRPWRCPHHPHAPHVATCTVCGTIGDERELVAMVPNDDAGCGAQVASHSAAPVCPPPVDVLVKETQLASHSSVGQATELPPDEQATAAGRTTAGGASPPRSPAPLAGWRPDGTRPGDAVVSCRHGHQRDRNAPPPMRDHGGPGHDT